jgi:hypothetical protein
MKNYYTSNENINECYPNGINFKSIEEFNAPKSKVTKDGFKCSKFIESGLEILRFEKEDNDIRIRNYEKCGADPLSEKIPACE